jgi:MFS family permease
VLFPDTFNIWAILPGSLFYLIGGGGAMAAAMVWTIVADVVPVAERTATFFQLTAISLSINVLVNPISALLLKYDPWIAMWLSFGGNFIGMGSVALIPETLTLRRKADERRRHAHDNAQGAEDGENCEPPHSHVGWRSFRSFKSVKEQILTQVVFTVRNDMKHVWQFIFGSKDIVLLILATSSVLPMRLIVSNILLQYMTKRFDWEWSTVSLLCSLSSFLIANRISQATFISNSGNLATVVALLIFLPIGSLVMTKRYHYDPLHKDLVLSRISSTFLAVGMFMMAFAPVPWLFVSSLVIMSLGNGLSALCRALLNAVIEPHTLATLNTTIGLVEMLMALWSGPAMGWLLSKGMKLQGIWQGLPFLALSFCTMGVSAAVFFFKIPSGAAQA